MFETTKIETPCRGSTGEEKKRGGSRSRFTDGTERIYRRPQWVGRGSGCPGVLCRYLRRQEDVGGGTGLTLRTVEGVGGHGRTRR